MILKHNIPEKLITTIKPYKYTASDFGIKGSSTGFSTKICIASTGIGDHKDIGEFADTEVFINGTTEPNDTIGASTMISGIIKSQNKKGLTGLAPKTKLYFAKCINDKKSYNTNSIISSMLWAYVNAVDIFVINAHLGKHNEYMQQAIDKTSNMVIISSHPCQYKNVISVKTEKTKKDSIKISGKNNIVSVKIPEKSKFYTTFLNNKYVIADNNTLALGIVSGLALLLAQKNKKNYTPKSICKNLLSLSV